MDIAQEQNTPESLRLLAAQKRLYSLAKRLHFVRIAAVLLLELAAPFVVLAMPAWRDGLELVGAVLTLVSALLLIGIEAGRVKQAATVQEQLDVHLFQLPWNETLVGQEVAPELINSAANEYKGGSDRIRDWYPDPGGVLYPKDALLCQRTNLMWGVRLQSTYAYTLLGITVGYLLVGVLIGILKQESLMAYLVALLVPALPALLEAIDTFRRHTESAREKAELLAHVEALLKDKKRPQRLIEECRRIQDSIYLMRSTRPLIPDWWYELWRSKFDLDAREGVQALKKRL
ncbi:MAG TPA: S-4TM family putative pore-forming effector [Ktedonobacteraceae bacterium]|jgi:hypothetical protein|nr:S-4TM family putative pore-forming effector [Ktedonobacteraceae bacterium]